jgi:hypothetical protein
MSNIKIYGQKSGNTLIKITKEGDNFYEPIVEYVSLYIKKINQTNLLLNNINKNTNEIYLDDKKTTFTLSVNNVQENAQIYYNIIQSYSSTENNTVCYIDKNNLIPLNEGICIIEATVYETENFLETRTNQIVISIFKKDQDDLNELNLVEINFNKSIKLKTLGGEQDSEQFTYTSSNSDICLIVNDMLIAKSTGKCLITAIKKGNATLNDVKQEYNIKVNKIEQSNLLFKNISLTNQIYINPNYGFDLSILNIQENANFLYSVSDPNICVIKDNKIYGISEGRCQVYGLVIETKNYLTTKTNIIDLFVSKNDQSDLIITKSGDLNYLSTVMLSTTGGSTDQEVYYETTTNTIKIINNVVFGLKYGLAKVIAHSDGNQMYNPVKKEIDFIVNKINQPNLKLKNINEGNKIFVNLNVNHKLDIFDVMENPLIKFIVINNYELNNSSNNGLNIVNILDNYLVGANEGTCLIQAISSETDNYLETKSEPMLINVIKNEQDPLIIDYDKTINFKETKYITVRGGNSINPPTVTVIDNDTNCTINGNQIYGNSCGVCPILIKKDADFMYNSIEKNIFVEVLPISQQNIFINDLNELNEIEVDPLTSFELNVNNTNENPTINYTIISQTPNNSDRPIIRLNNSKSIIPLNEGSVDIQATMYMTNNYIQTLSPILTINVILKSAANYTVDKIYPLYFNSSINITVNNGTFTDEYEIVSSNPNLLIVDNQVFGKKSGQYNFIISKKATFMYSALKKNLRIFVNKIYQPNFNFINLNTTYYVDPLIGFDLLTSVVNENATVRFVIVNQNSTSNSIVCTIKNNQIFACNEGYCLIKAFTTETENYISTETNIIKINIIKKEQTPIILSSIGELFYQATTNFDISGGSIDSNLSVTKNNDCCAISINNKMLTGLNAGLCKIDIIKQGNYMYNNSLFTFNVFVKKISQTIKLENINSENLLVNEPGILNPLIITGIKENAKIRYILSNPSICIISNNNLLTQLEGKTTIKAIISETSNYLETHTNTITIDIIKMTDHEFTIIPSDDLLINKTILLKVTSLNITNPIVIKNNDDKVLIDGNHLTGLKYGITNLTISQKGDDLHSDLVTDYNIMIKKIPQNIVLHQINSNNLINVDDNNAYNLIVDNIQENANITYQITNTSNQISASLPCYIKDGKLYSYCEGSCTIQAQVNETTNYQASFSNTINLTIFRNKDIKILNDVYNINFGTLYDLSKIDDTLIYEINNNDNCQIINNILFAKKTGKYTITYFKPADRLFYELQKTFLINVLKIKQTATFLNINNINTIYVNPNINIPLQVSGVKENANIFFNILNNDDHKCTIKNNNLIGLKSGNCIIEVYLGETDNYLSTKLNSININIIKNDQIPISINFSGPINYNDSIIVTILGGSTDNESIITSSDPNVCFVVNSTIIGISAKSCILTVTKQGNFMYNDIIKTHNITVNKIYQDFQINPFNRNNTIYVNPEVSQLLTTSGLLENPKIIYYPLFNEYDPIICSINNDRLFSLLSGFCYIQAKTLETDNYLETTSSQLFLNIIKNNQQEIGITYLPLMNLMDTQYLQVIGGNTSSLAIPTIDISCCTINQNYLLTTNFVGTTNINFYKEGNFMYNPINKVISITINKINQQNISINNLNSSNEIYVDPDIGIDLNVNNVNDNPQITFTIISQQPVQNNTLIVGRITNNKLICLNEGTLVIKATCLETSNYLETDTLSITIKVILKSPNNFLIDNLPKLYYNSSVNLTISGSFDPTIYQITTINDGIGINVNTLTGLKTGKFRLTVTRLATFQFSAIIKTIDIFVYKIPQPKISITNSNLTLLINPQQSYTLETNIPEENAIIKFILLSNISHNGEQICTLNNNQITCINNGQLLVKALCLETSNYLQTESTIVIFNIIKNDQTPIIIDNLNNLNNLYVNKSINLTISGGNSRNENIYYVNNNNCYISNNQIHGTNAGMSTINIFKKGDNMYNDISSSFNVYILKIFQTVTLQNINNNNEFYAFTYDLIPLVISGTKENPVIQYKILDDSSKNIINSSNNNVDVCKISGNNNLIILNPGSCSIQAILKETSNYLETNTNIIKINVLKNIISNLNITQTDILYINSNIQINIDNINMSDVTIIPNNNKVSISGNIIYGIQAGNVQLNISKGDTELYKGFNIFYNIKVNKLIQYIKLDNINNTNTLFINPNIGININVTDVRDNAIYIVRVIESKSNDKNFNDNNVCNIVDNKLFVLGYGYCILQAEAYETTNYTNAISNQLYITFVKKEGTQITENIVNTINYLDTINLNSITGNNGTEILYESSNDNCKIINNTLFAQRVGKTILKTYFPPTVEYNDTIKYFNIEIVKIPQPNLILKNITIDNIINVNPSKTYNLDVENINENATCTFYVSDLTICRITNRFLIPLNEGQCQVYFITNETTNYSSTRSNILNISVLKNDQSNLYLTKEKELFYNSSIKILSTGGNTESTVIYTTNSTNCQIINDNVIGLSYGMCTIIGYKEGNFMYNPLSRTINIFINKIYQPSFILNEIPTLYVDPDTPIEIKNTQPNENANVRYELINNNNNNIITINNNIIYTLNAGSCQLKAITSETTNYLETESNIINITIIKKQQRNINIIYPTTIDYLSETQLVLSGTSTNIPFKFTYSNLNCIIDTNYKLKGFSFGECSINILKEGNYMYENIQKDIHITIIKIPQQNVYILPFNQLNEIEVDPDNAYYLTISGINENPLITYQILSSSSNENIINITNNNLKALKSGVCSIKAILSETTNYLQTETPILRLNIILKSPNNFIVDKLLPLYYNSFITITVNNGEFNNNYILNTSSTGISISGNIIYGLQTGNWNFTITKIANSIYQSLTKTISIDVQKINQPLIQLVDLSNNILINPSNLIKININNLLENATITYRIVNNSGIDGDLVLFDSNNNFFPLSSGQLKIYVITSETNNYLSTKSDLFIININKKEQSNLIFNNDNILDVGSTITLDVSGGNTNRQIIYTLDNDLCYIQNNIIYGVKAGNCNLTAIKFGNNLYNDKTETIKLTVKKISQTIRLNNINDNNTVTINYFDGPELFIEGCKEEPNITYNVVDLSGTNVCSINTDRKVIAQNVGICTIEGLVYETSNYLPTKTNKITVIVLPLSNDKLLIQPSGILYYNSSINLLVSGGSLNGKVTLTTTDTICSIQNNTINGLQAGNCSINVFKEGDNNNIAIDTTITLKINKIEQTITLNNLNSINDILTGDEMYLQVLNIQENAIIDYTIQQNDQYCYIDNRGKLIALKAGTCTIQAISSETKNYALTKSNILQITITQKKQASLIHGGITNINYQNSINLSTISGALTGNVNYTSSNTNCEITSNILFGKYAGLCTIYARNNTDIKEFVIKINKINLNNLLISDLVVNNKIFVNPQKGYSLQVLNNIENANYNIFISDMNICNIQNNNIYGINEGTCNIYIKTLETDNYFESTSNTINIQVIKNTQQPLIYFFNPNKLFYKSYTNIIVDGGSIDSNISFTTNDTNCEITNNILHGKNCGEVTINVFKYGNNMFNDLKDTFKINIEKINQYNFFLLDINNTNTIFVNPNTAIQLFTSNVYDNVSIIYKVTYLFSNQNSNIVTINGNNLYANFVGKCNITAIALETNNYLETNSNTITVNIIKNNQDNLVINCPNQINFMDSIYIEVYGGNTTNKLVFNVNNDSCIIDDNYKLTGNKIGESIITITKAGNDLYNDLIQTIQVEVIKITQQNIIIEDINELNEIPLDNNLSYNLNVLNINEFSVIIYQIINSVPDNLNNLDVCQLNNNILTPINTGYIDIKATTSETNNYLSTDTPFLRLIVVSNDPNNFYIDKLPILYYKSKIKITINKNRFNINDYQFTSNSNLISINNNEITGINSGSDYLSITKNGITKQIKFTVNKIQFTQNTNLIEDFQNTNLIEDFQNTNLIFKIINLNDPLFVNPDNSIQLETTILPENPIISFSILSYIVDGTSDIIGFIENNRLKVINSGTFRLQAIPNNTTNYDYSKMSYTIDINVKKNNQNPLSIIAPNTLLIGTTAQITIEGGNTLNEPIISIDNGNCSIFDSNIIYGVNSGDTTITIIRPGNNMYNDISTNIVVKVLKISQNIILNNINNNNNVDLANQYELELSGIKENPTITFTSNNDFCKINNGKLIAEKAGICIIYATTSETTNYYATQSNSITLTITPLKEDELTINYNPLYYNSFTEIKISGGPINSNTRITTLSDDICSISGNIIFGKEVGSCKLKIEKSTITKEIFITVNKTNQTLKLNDISINNNIYIDDNRQITLDGVLENSTITYNSSNEQICTITNGQINALKKGTVNIYAVTSETDHYLSTRSNIITLRILKKSIELNSNIIQLKLNINETTTLSPFILTNSNYTNIIYKLNNLNCTIQNNILKAINYGNCTITATLSGDILQTKIYYVKINKIFQPEFTILLNDYNNYYFVNPTIPHNITISQLNENPILTFRSTNNSICKFENNQIFCLNKGEVTIYIQTSETSNYLSTESNKLTLKFVKNNQANLIFENINLYYNTLTQLIVNGGSINTITKLSTDSSNCKIVGNQIYGVACGPCEILISKNGNFMYNNIETSIILLVNKIQQPHFIINNINMNNIININLTTPIKLSVSNTFENPTILFEITNTDTQQTQKINIDGFNLYPTITGTYSVIAIAKETENYLDTRSTPLIITVIKNNQLQVNFNIPLTIDYKQKIYIQTSGGNTDIPIQFFATNSNCIINNDNQLIGNNAGNCTITLGKLDNDLYNSYSQNISVLKIRQKDAKIIKFNELNELQVGLTENYLNVSDYYENAKVTFIIVNETKTVTLSGNILIAINPGLCQVKAILDETNNYTRTETPIINIKIINNNPNDFTIDTLNTINYKIPFNITVNNNYYNITEYDIVPKNNDAFIINHNTITPLISGEQKIGIVKRSTDTLPSITKIITIQIIKLEQPDFNFVNLNKQIFIQKSYTLTTTNINENAKVTFKIISTNANGNLGPVCQIDNNLLSALNVGFCLIQAVTAETNNYKATLSPIFNIECKKNEQSSLIINKINNLYYNSFITFSVLGGNTDNQIQLQPYKNHCYINENRIYGLNAGKTKITLFKPGNEIYSDIKMTLDLFVYKINQKIILLNINDTNKINQGSYHNLIINGIKENPHIEYNIVNTFSLENNERICYFNNNKLYANFPGVVIIEAVTTETKNYLSTKTNQIVVTIKPQPQNDLTIIPSGTLYYKSDIDLNIYGGNINSEIKITSYSNNCSISGTTIYGNKVGKCKLNITKNGNNIYDKITKDYIINIEKIIQIPTIEILNIINNTIYADNNTGYIIKVSNVFESPNIQYKLLTNINNCCQIIGNKLYGINNGTFSIYAVISETTSYLETQTSNIKINVIKKNQDEIITDLISTINFNDSFNLNSIGGSSNNDFTYQLSNDCCSINNDILIGKRAGICNIKITKGGNNIYNDIFKEINVRVNKIFQPEITINNINQDNTLLVNPNIKYQLTTTSVNENPTLIFYSSDPNIANIINGELYCYIEGTCYIYVDTTETTNYLVTRSNNLSLNIIKNDQSDLYIDLSNNLVFNGSSIINTYGGSTLNVCEFTINNNNAQIINNTIIGKHTGECKITATKPGNFMYKPISTNIYIDINKASQQNFTLNNINLTNDIFVDLDNPIRLNVSNVLGNPIITYNINYENNNNNVYINNGYIYAKSAGICYIKAVTTEIENYIATSSNTLKVTVIKKQQNDLIVNSPTNLNINEKGYVTIKGGSSIHPAILSSNDNNISISGNIIIGLKVGTFNINIIKDGDNVYLPIQTQITINILRTQQTKVILRNINHTNEIMIDPNKQIDLFLDNLLDNPSYTFEIVDNKQGICDISNNKLITRNIGSCTVKAIISETENYLKTEINSIITVIFNDSLQFFIDTIPSLKVNESYNLTISSSFDNTKYRITNNNNDLIINNNIITGKKVGTYTINVTKIKTTITDELTKNINIIITGLDQPLTFNLNTNYFINNIIPIDFKPNNILETDLITYSILSSNQIGEYNDDICLSRDNKIYANNQGLCTIQARIPKTTNYNQTDIIFTINIIRNPQINIDISQNSILVDSFIDISYNNSLRPIFFNKDNSIYFVNNRIYGLLPGKNKFIIFVKGNLNYEPLYQIASIFVLKKQQNVTLQNINDGEIILHPNIGYKLFVTNIKENPQIRYNVTNGFIRNKLFYPFRPGNSEISLVLSETHKYLETSTNKINILVRSIIRDFINIQLHGVLYYNSSITYSIITNDYSSNVTFSLSNNNCIIRDNLIFGAITGECLIRATKNNTSGQIISKDFSIKIQKIKQNVRLVDINDNNNTIYINENIGIDLNIIGINESPTITFKIKKTFNTLITPCEIRDNKLFAVSGGSCYISVVLSETQNYLITETNKILVTVLKNNINDIILNNITNNTIKVFDPINLDFTDNNINLYSNSDKCIIDNNTIIGKKLGRCIITLYKDSTNIENKFIKNFIINIIKNNQTDCILNNINSTNTINVNDIVDLNVTNILDNAHIIYSISSFSSNNNNNICIINNNKLIAINEGICLISAIVTETNNYNQFITNNIIVKIVKKNQESLKLVNNLAINYLDSIKLNDKGGNTDNDVEYTSNNNNITIFNNVLIGMNTGTTIITSKKKGNQEYTDVISTFNVIVNKIFQSNLKIGGLTNSTLNINSTKGYNLFVTGTIENPEIIFQIVNNSNICSFDSNNNLYALKEGICYIVAITTETTNYLATTSEPIKITVIKNNQQNITINTLNNLFYNSSITLTISGETSSSSIKYYVIDSSNCSVTNNILFGKYSGICTIRAVKEGNELYDSVETTFKVIVKKIRQPNFTLYKLDNVTISLTPYILKISNLYENPNISYRILTSVSTKNQIENIVYISDNRLYAIRTGVCIIQAFASETDNYLSIKSNQIIITISVKQNIMSSNIVLSASSSLSKPNIFVVMPISVLQKMINNGLPVSAINTVQNITASNINFNSEEAITQLLNVGVPQTNDILDKIIQIANNAIPISISNMPILKVLPTNIIHAMVIGGLPASAINIVQQLISLKIPLNSAKAIQQLNGAGVKNATINKIITIKRSAKLIPLTNNPIKQLPLDIIQKLIENDVPLTAINTIQELVSIDISLKLPQISKQFTSLGLSTQLINTIQELTNNVKTINIPNTKSILSYNIIQQMISNGLPPNAVNIIQELVSAKISLKSDIAIRELTKFGLSSKMIINIQLISESESPVNVPITNVMQNPPIIIESISQPITSTASSSF